MINRCFCVEIYQRLSLNTSKCICLFSSNQEKVKPVPTLASSEYGHRLENEYDKPDRLHVRIGYVQSEFYRRNGIPWVIQSMFGSLGLTLHKVVWSELLNMQDQAHLKDYTLLPHSTKQTGSVAEPASNTVYICMGQQNFCQRFIFVNEEQPA